MCRFLCHYVPYKLNGSSSVSAFNSADLKSINTGTHGSVVKHSSINVNTVSNIQKKKKQQNYTVHQHMLKLELQGTSAGYFYKGSWTVLGLAHHYKTKLSSETHVMLAAAAKSKQHLFSVPALPVSHISSET